MKGHLKNNLGSKNKEIRICFDLSVQYLQNLSLVKKKRSFIVILFGNTDDMQSISTHNFAQNYFERDFYCV